jgi:hypothetical protein
MPILESWQADRDREDREQRTAQIAAETKASGHTPCDACGQPACVLVGSHVHRFNSFRCEGACLTVAITDMAVRGHAYCTVTPLRRPGGFHTSDGRYFASDVNAATHQRLLDARKESEGRRRAAYLARTTENGAQNGAIVDMLDGRTLLSEFSDSRDEPNGPEPRRAS